MAAWVGSRRLKYHDGAGWVDADPSLIFFSVDAVQVTNVAAIYYHNGSAWVAVAS